MKGVRMHGLLAGTALLLALAGAPATAMQHGGAEAKDKAVETQQEDARTLVKLDAQREAAFLAMMRGFMDSLNSITAALAEGNFSEAARIAREEMGPAHEMMAKLKAANVPEKKIKAVAEGIRGLMKKMVEEGGAFDAEKTHAQMRQIMMKTLGGPLPGMKPGEGRQRFGGGFGPFLPPEMRLMGLQTHLSAADFADAAEAVAASGKADAEAYKKVLGALSEVTAMCSACHAAWRLR